ncbi:MAG TPA: hypothetical protein VLP43_09155 [Solirubrobacteraceae bacterium]|nr:hypothetical protein [Solirubrobacteraceae bacterium]
MQPEEAPGAARRRAAELRAQGIYPPEGPGLRPPVATDPDPSQMHEWALIEPDLREVRSTRRFGAPMTALKRTLLRLLGQYLGQIISQQSRFNVHLLSRVRALEQRVEELERLRDER